MTAQHSLSAHKQDLVNLSAADAAASWQGYVESVGEMLGGQNVFVKLAVIILAVTCGVSMFAYLHNRRKVDFYHSLPVKRETWLLLKAASGLVIFAGATGAAAIEELFMGAIYHVADLNLVQAVLGKFFLYLLIFLVAYFLCSWRC